MCVINIITVCCTGIKRFLCIWNALVIQYYLSMTVLSIFSCLCECELFHSRCNINGTLLRNLPSSAFKKMADTESFLQDDCRLLDNSVHHMHSHSCIQQIPCTTDGQCNVQGDMVQSLLAQDVHRLLGLPVAAVADFNHDLVLW